MLTASSKVKKTTVDLGHPVAVIIKALGIFLLSQFIAAFIIEIFIGFSGHRQSASDILNGSIVDQALFVVMAEGLAALAAVWLVRRRQIGLSIIGLGRKPAWRDLKYTLLGFGGFIVLLIITSGLINVFLPHINNQPQDLGFNNLKTTGDNALAFFALVLLPPLGEEPLVRGYLFGGLRARWPFLPTLLVTSLLFGIAHLEFGNSAPLVWGAGIETFVLSCVLCYMREKSGALYAGMAVHMLNNMLAFGVHFHG